MMFEFCRNAQKQIEAFLKLRKTKSTGIIAVIFLTLLSLLPMMLDPTDAAGG
jgi:hypothetical protein